MGSDLRSLLKLEVPLIVLLGARQLRMSEVLALAPGAIIELPKNAEDQLELLANNKVIGAGHAVKVGENFGIRVERIGDLRGRIAALGVEAEEAAEGAPEGAGEDAGPMAMAAEPLAKAA